MYDFFIEKFVKGAVLSGKISKIAILRFGAIGDVVHSTGLVRSIKEQNPDADIHYITFALPAPLIQNDPDIKKVWVLEGKKYSYLFKVAKEMRNEKFDLFINLQPSIRTKVFALLSGAKRVVTYKKSFKYHAVENFWRTVLPVLPDLKLGKNLQLHIPQHVIDKMKAEIPSEMRFVCLNPGASNTREGRKWPVEYWQELISLINNNTDWEIILTGSKNETELCDLVSEKAKNKFSFCGKLSIEETAALMSLCDVVVSPDTGPLHIATAVNTVAIGLYGAAPVSRTGPFGHGHIAVNSERKCVPCNRRKCKFKHKDCLYTPCLEDISPEMLFNAVKKAIEPIERS